MASQALVPGSAGVASGGSLPPSSAEGSSQTAPLPSLSHEPPRVSANWHSYVEQTARHLGFSSRVAHQLAFCRRSSTRLNYQANWPVYRACVVVRGILCHVHRYLRLLTFAFIFVVPSVSLTPLLRLLALF